MPRPVLTEAQRSTVENALRVAADRYVENAQTCREAGHPRLAEQFERQTREARALADQFANDEPELGEGGR